MIHYDPEHPYRSMLDRISGLIQFDQMHIRRRFGFVNARPMMMARGEARMMKMKRAVDEEMAVEEEAVAEAAEVAVADVAEEAVAVQDFANAATLGRLPAKPKAHLILPPRVPRYF